MTAPDFGRLRWRLLAANLVVAAAGVVAVVAGVWLAAPGAFDDAMGMRGSGGMMGGNGDGMMDPILRSAFGEAVGSALFLGLLAAVVVAIGASVLLATRLSRPIDDLAVASRRLAGGDYAQRVPPAAGELGDLATSFNEMAATLGAQEQHRRDLIGDVAHELRTPIASVRGYVEGLQSGVFAPGPEAWRVLDEQTARLEHLVDDLADLWRAESHDLRLEIVALDAQTVLDDVQRRHAAAATDRAMTISVGDVTPAGFRGDRVRVAQVLDNLVGNALRYGRAGGHIWLVAVLEPSMIVLGVHDDGPGLTPDQASRVFDRFYRADPSRSREAGGSGLGLAISRSFVEAMGGSITVSSPGVAGGSDFSVRLRLA